MSQEASQKSRPNRPYKEYYQNVDHYLKHYPTDRLFHIIKIEKLLSAGRYKLAFLFLKNSSALHPEMKDDLTNTYRKYGAQYFDISEEIIGQKRGIFKSQPCLLRQDGDFVGAVEIKMTSNGSGRGLFATENIEQGDVLLIGKALAVSPEPAANHNPLLQITRDVLNSCGEKSLQIFLTHGVNDRSRLIPKMYDFVAEFSDGNLRNWVNLWRKLNETEKGHAIGKILDLIAFDDSSPVAMKEKSKEPAVFEHVPARMYYGVWLLPSFINHSCVPNAARFNMVDLMRIHATRDIKSGEEITIPYFNVLVPFPSRLASCSKFGFACVCKRCDLEANKLKKCSELKTVYADYARICLSSELEKRASQLEELFFRVKECVRFLRETAIFSDTNEMFEKWHSASFTPVYLASILNRDMNEVSPEICLIKDINFWETTNGMVETCPGSLLCLLFYQVFRGKLREFLALHGNGIRVCRKEMYETHVTDVGIRMLKISRSIYGNPHRYKFVDHIIKQLV